MDISQIVSHLVDLPIPQIKYHDQTGSTNDEALRWISQDAPDGCLVIADSQTSGRGRLGRHWVTLPGAALAFSLILRPSQHEFAAAGFFTALGALAICRALETQYGLKPEIKWPNDVLLSRKKAAGILVETSWVGNNMQGLVLGIGINVTKQGVPLPHQLIFPATSVEEAAGQPIDRLKLLRSILSETFAWRAKIGEPVFLSAWEERLAFQGEWVTIQSDVNSPTAPLEGELVGLDAAGSLLLRQASGELVKVSTGDVHL